MPGIASRALSWVKHTELNWMHVIIKGSHCRPFVHHMLRIPHISRQTSDLIGPKLLLMNLLWNSPCFHVWLPFDHHWLSYLPILPSAWSSNFRDIGPLFELTSNFVGDLIPVLSKPYCHLVKLPWSLAVFWRVVYWMVCSNIAHMLIYVSSKHFTNMD